MAAERKVWKYAELEFRYLFQPTVVESLRPINDSAMSFLSDLDGRIADVSGENWEGGFLFQWLPVWIEHFNAVFHDSFVDKVVSDWHSSWNNILIDQNFVIPHDYILPRVKIMIILIML